MADTAGGLTKNHDQDFGLYVHIPFCRSKCPYCQFTSEIGREKSIPRYVSALLKEHQRRVIGTPTTVYIGGGTPSLLPPDTLSSLLEHLSLNPDMEVTIESNPESLQRHWLCTARMHHCSRISIGIQSLVGSELVTLGRVHDVECAVDSVKHARIAGFKNISVDLMYGIPGQTVESFKKTLHEVCALSPEHISAYALSIEQDTAYAEFQAQYGLRLPENETIADMYLMMDELMGSAGYQRYEISNFALPGYECKHNQAYWDFTSYTGIGVSAHSFDGTTRRWNVNSLHEYITCIENGDDVIADQERMTDDMLLTEKIMLSLRTRNGLDNTIFQTFPDSIKKQCCALLERFSHAGVLEKTSTGTYKLTTRGVMLADEIIAEVLACLP